MSVVSIARRPNAASGTTLAQRFKNAPPLEDPLLAAILRYMLGSNELPADAYVANVTNAAVAGAHALLSGSVNDAFDEYALGDVVGMVFAACDDSKERVRQLRQLQQDDEAGFLITDLTIQAALVGACIAYEMLRGGAR